MAIKRVDSPKQPWELDWTDPNGRRRRKRFKTKREAEDFDAKRRQSVRGGTYVDPKLSQKLTVAALYAEWFNRISTSGARGKGPATPKTLDNYRRQYINYIEPRWGDTPLSAVSYDDIEAWATSLLGRDGKPAGAATRREVALTFGRLMGEAVRRRYLAENPAKNAAGQADYVPGKGRKSGHVYLTMPQLLAIASHAGDYELMILLAGLTGLRWGEITALTVGDVKLGDRPQLAVTKAYSEVSGRHDLGATKGGESRTVPIPAPIAERLRLVIEGRDRRERVFSSANGHVLRNSLFAKRHYKPAIAAAAGTDEDFPRPKFHSLRHTAVSLAISEGANVKVVQRIAGHASATMTLDTYAGLFDDDLHDSADRLSAALVKHGFK
ncbi:site-specific integrase [Arthrobacter sp. H5]|uniref:tyrosine-type recombinase/integrase n=1 Tax=Arthrobacter sp. H5 TaxID=1267973 RepID=UPI0004AE0F38|nr:site-specific integrase [Arthrobacter sp. H5]